MNFNLSLSLFKICPQKYGYVFFILGIFLGLFSEGYLSKVAEAETINHLSLTIEDSSQKIDSPTHQEINTPEQFLPSVTAPEYMSSLTHELENTKEKLIPKLELGKDEDSNNQLESSLSIKKTIKENLSKNHFTPPLVTENPSRIDDLGELRVRPYGSMTPPLVTEKPSKVDDLGELRIRPLPMTDHLNEGKNRENIPSSTVFFNGGVSYFQSDNLFSATDPIQDSLINSQIGVSWVKPITQKTAFVANLGGNWVHYSQKSDFDYDRLRMGVGVRRMLSPTMKGEFGWSNQQLFDMQGNRFLNDHALYLNLVRRDRLSSQLSLDSFYEFRTRFDDPATRSQIVNTLGVGLNYDLSPKTALGLNYRLTLANYTDNNRDDSIHNVTLRMSRKLSPTLRLSGFVGMSEGASNNRNIDFNGFLFGFGLDINIPLN